MGVEMMGLVYGFSFLLSYFTQRAKGRYYSKLLTKTNLIPGSSDSYTSYHYYYDGCCCYQFTFLYITQTSPIEKPNLNEKTLFWGKSLNVQVGLKIHDVRLCPPIQALEKRRKELPFDKVIQRDKKLKLVMKIPKILLSQHDRVMQLRDLGRFRRALGLQKRRHFIALLRKFPRVFEIEEEGVYSLRFKLTPEAETLYLEEMKVRNDIEDLLVVKFKKLLMMSLEKRILVEKIAHLKNDLGFLWNFVIPSASANRSISGSLLCELEKQEVEDQMIIDRPPKFNRIRLPKGLQLSRAEMRQISQFRDMPYISPYSDFSTLNPGTPEKEKHACAVVQEILSLTVEKRTLVDHLTHF
ncbi:hypothetical protein R6Q57_024120 [Mikania cordata]